MLLNIWVKNARIVLVDQSKRGLGDLSMPDCFYQSDTKLEKENFCEKNVGNSPLFEYSGKDGSGYRTDGYMDW